MRGCCNELYIIDTNCNFCALSTKIDKDCNLLQGRNRVLIPHESGESTQKSKGKSVLGSHKRARNQPKIQRGNPKERGNRPRFRATPKPASPRTAGVPRKTLADERSGKPFNSKGNERFAIQKTSFKKFHLTSSIVKVFSGCSILNAPSQKCHPEKRFLKTCFRGDRRS